MATTQTTDRPAAARASAGRRDFYAGVHKALRLLMARTLCALGSADPGDAQAVRAALDLLERLLAMCEQHARRENEFVHPALERARPGSAARITAEHERHAAAIAGLRELAVLVADSPYEGPRAATLGRLYRALALFVADNFQHMHLEETAHNAVLWADYTDAELDAIERAMVASIPPASLAEVLRWYLPALSAPERARLLGRMRRGMPPQALRAALGIAERTLSPHEHARLLRDLGVSAAAP